MPTYLDVFKDAYAKLRAFRGPNFSLDQECQKMAGYYMQWAIQGNENGIDVSVTADAAAAKNGLNTSPINEAQPGELVYWSNNHVMRVVGHTPDGRAVGASTSLKGDTIEGTQIDRFWKLTHIDTYPGPYIGRSNRDGRSTQTSPYPYDSWPPAAVQIAADQRQARANIGAVNVRAGAATSSAVVETFTPSQIITVAGFVHGQKLTQNGVTTDLWYVTGTDGAGNANRFAFAGGFLTSGADGLTQWHDPIPVPPVEPEPPVDPPVVVPPVEEPPVIVPPVIVPPAEKPDPPVTTRPKMNTVAIIITSLVGAAVVLYNLIVAVFN